MSKIDRPLIPINNVPIPGKVALTKVDHFMDTPHPNGINVGKTYEGFFEEPLKIGISARFKITSSKEDLVYRCLTTTPVIEITSDGFKTKNSRYKITPIDD